MPVPKNGSTDPKAIFDELDKQSRKFGTPDDWKVIDPPEGQKAGVGPALIRPRGKSLWPGVDKYWKDVYKGYMPGDWKIFGFEDISGVTNIMKGDTGHEFYSTDSRCLRCGAAWEDLVANKLSLLCASPRPTVLVDYGRGPNMAFTYEQYCTMKIEEQERINSHMNAQIDQYKNALDAQIKAYEHEIIKKKLYGY